MKFPESIWTGRPVVAVVACLAAVTLAVSARSQPVSVWPPALPSSAGIPSSPLVPSAIAKPNAAESNLMAVRAALQDGRIGDAQADLNQAETALRQAPRRPGGESQAERAILDVGVARHAVATHDQAEALRAIDDALVVVGGTGLVAPDSGGVALSPPPPMVTYAWLPGHWAPHGSGFVWVPPDTVGRLVVGRTWIPEGWVWRNGQYVWVPAHWE